ncbi:glycosyltransferase [Candidatus Nanohalococcus occultus]|uniref:glycosyltransferase n=1 Tax=Candidatus Nanohalococcus occultus TaxID=2978047 RepID=UPI0039E1CCEC
MSSSENQPAVSVILPTLSETPVITELEEMMKGSDELLVVCDTERDPIAKSSAFDSNERVKIIIAGEPEACSGKANAIYKGMRAAENNRVVWTDDDFHHPEDWLDQLHTECNRHGAVSELPFFIGKNPIAMLNEPIYALVMGVTWLENQAWGGAVMFDRDMFDEEAFLEELRSTVADDVLLSEHLDGKTVRRTRRVEIDPTVRESLERITRFLKHVRYHEPLKTAMLGIGFSVIAGLCIYHPIRAFTASTLSFMGAYLFLGEKRPTFLLGFLSLITFPLFLVYGLSRKTFVWQGRRYKYNSKLDVEILE